MTDSQTRRIKHNLKKLVVIYMSENRIATVYSDSIAQIYTELRLAEALAIQPAKFFYAPKAV